MMAYGSCRMVATILIIAIFFHEPCIAETPPNYTFMHEAINAPKISFYDYIVVGGGLTGIPLATTLSQNYSVLLLERGGSPYGNPDITNSANFGNYFLDPSPDSPAELFMSEDGVGNARPRVLGGGTSINAGLYTRDDKKFFKEARLTDEKLVNSSYEFLEKVMVFEPVVTEWQSAWKGAFMEAGVTPYNGFTYDYLIGTKVGGTTFDENGKRHTAADLLQYANPLALSVYLRATVRKVLFMTKGRTRPMAYGVVFEDASGNKHRAYLKEGKGEIILSAGPLGSPQLLMLSGVGPKDQLDAHQIELVLNQPLVGQGMADNPLNAIFIPSPIPVEQSIVQVIGTQVGSQIEQVSSINLVLGSPSDYQGFSYEMGGFVFSKLDGPFSTGELKLQSGNPTDIPSVKFNYFKDPRDLKKCVNGISTILTAIESRAFSKFKYANMTAQDILELTVKLPTYLPIHANTSLSLEQFCKDTVRSVWQFHGGCQIGKVVDDDYKVIGADTLRVIDGSTLLNAPANLLMLGRYMGLTILAQRLESDKSESGLWFTS
ncbi:protein HOTHEAD-like [Cynara cardunculus var. scolymus]|uniref:Glucose-methanol-choline oxidoreductase n=1 Tax=Cynara cardunculus var. scolymus TaxID=59895 RepID=A0A103Y213_CYNCS|nr:protein HOTHEAD-like [Cynara cardunculus var. scolymus]KVI01056.1 Glucose-methanol-choline oxidoreductase [Cynara cardunculus var. scolymus]